MYKVLGIALVVLALAIGIVPQFTHCPSHPASMGSSSMQIPMSSGMNAPMAMSSTPKCQTTAKSEIAVAVPLFGVGAVLTFSRRKNLILGLSAGGAVLGVMAIALPAAITGTCSMPTMICNTVMKPALYTLGSFAIVGSVVGMIVSSRMKN